MRDHAEKCLRAAEIARERGPIDLCDVEGGDVGIFGPELADVLAAAASGSATEVTVAVRKLAEVILFAAREEAP